jgi:hypothetical protein
LYFNIEWTLSGKSDPSDVEIQDLTPGITRSCAQKRMPARARDANLNVRMLKYKIRPH